MNWFSKKILTRKIKDYFYLQDDNDIEVSIVGKHKIKCTNLTLKPEIVNTPQMPIHVRILKIKTLQVQFNKQNATEPLNIQIDELHLTMICNSDIHPYDVVKENKKKDRPVLDEFYSAIGSDQEYQERSFVQEEIHQLKRIFGEYFLGKLRLVITNVDISFQYGTNQKLKYFGLEIKEVQLKERLVLHTADLKDEIKTSEKLFCLLNQIGVYFAIGYDENVISKEARHREIIRKTEKRKKNFILSKKMISIDYNLDEKLLSVCSNELDFQFQEILIHEIVSVANLIEKFSSNKPILRPGQGKIIDLGKESFNFKNKLYNKSLMVSEGTILWWQSFGKRIIDKFNKRQNLNILKNKKFRKYLFLLLYRYTFGSTPEIEHMIDEYEYFKSDKQIMKYNKFIIEKINRVQTQKQVNLEVKGFITFLNTVVKGDPELQRLKIRKIEYKDIKNSKIMINYQNCKKFIEVQEGGMKDYLAIDIKIDFIQLQIQRIKNYDSFKADIDYLSPSEYHMRKNEILQFYCDELIMESADSENENVEEVPENEKKKSKYIRPQQKTNKKPMQKQKTFIIFTVTNLLIEFSSQDNAYISVPSFTIEDVETSKTIFLMKNLKIDQQNMHPEAYNWKIETQKQVSLRINFFYFHLDNLFIQKILTIYSFISKPEIEQREDLDFINNFISKKVPKHSIFNNYSKASKEVAINQLIITTPVFDEDRTFQVNLNSITYLEPVNSKSSFGVDKILLLRSNLQNVQSKLDETHKRQSKKIDAMIIMGSTRPFNGSINKGYESSLTSILIPFILVQISCQDAFYLVNILRVWSKILKSHYFFPPKVQNATVPKIKIKDTSIEFSKTMQKIVEHKSILQIQFEGTEYFLLSDYINEENNKILDCLVDTLIFRQVQTYTKNQTTIELNDVYIRNCIGEKDVDKEALTEAIKHSWKFGDKSILINNSNSQIKKKPDADLLFYSDSPIPNSKQSSEIPFVSIHIDSTVYLESQKSLTNITSHIYPLFLFYSPALGRVLKTVLKVILELSEERIEEWENKVKNSSTKCLFEEYNFHDDKMVIENNEYKKTEVLMSYQFEKKMKVNVNVDRINLLIVKNATIVYTISLNKIVFKHQTEPYIKKFLFTATRFSIIDTSDETGPYPIIADAKKENEMFPICGSFTIYESEIIRFKEGKSALFHLTINGPEIFFLKKKIIELLNLLNIIMRQLGLQPEPSEVIDAPTQNIKSPVNPQQPQFCYKVEICRPKLKILINSLANQGFNAIGNSVIISNFTIIEREQSSKHSFVDQQSINLDVEMQNIPSSKQHYSEISRIENDNNLEFKSFVNESQEKASSQSKIQIRVSQVHIFGGEHWNKSFEQILKKEIINQPIKPIIEMPLIFIEFLSPEMSLDIPNLFAELKPEDFVTLMRIVQENLSESPTLFVDPPIVRKVIQVGFRTLFSLQEIIIALKIKSDNSQLNKDVDLTISGLLGKNEMWTSNENSTEVSFRMLTLTTHEKVKIIYDWKEASFFTMIPELQRSKKYTNLSDYPAFEEMRKENVKIWNQLHNKKSQHMHLLKRESVDEEEGNQNIEGVNKNETNTQKITRWVKGMCNKCAHCCICFKNQKKELDNENIEKVLKFMTKKNMNDETIDWNEEEVSYEKDPLQSVIYKLGNILDFQYPMNYEHISQKKREHNMLFLRYCIKPNGESHMYLQIKTMGILLDKTKRLLDVVSFLILPFSNPQTPPYIRKPKFNNLKPSKMIVEFNDSFLQIKTVDPKQAEERIVLLIQAVYDTESKGELTNGPGRSKMLIEAVLKILFFNQFTENPIELSDNIKATYQSSQVVPFGEHERKRSEQKILFTSYQAELQTITFYIPVYMVKSLLRILTDNFVEKKANVDKNYPPPKKEEDEDFLSAKNSCCKKSKSNEDSSDNREDSIKQREESHARQTKELEEKEKQEEKKNQPKTKKLFMSRILISPQIALHIESKEKNSLIEAQLSSIKYNQVAIAQNNIFMSNRTIKAGLSVNYWNLKVGIFEPCIEPWNFKIEQDYHVRDYASSTNFKISSDLNSWNVLDDYVNDLNINISTALFQTYKELVLKYEQQNYDENEICNDLTLIDNSIPKQKKNYPAELKTYFGRKFETEQNFNMRKRLRMINKDEFNPLPLRVFVYHSYFDHIRKMKKITYRTPYRIFNSSNVDLELWFYVPKPKQRKQWTIKFNKFQFYAIPKEIYKVDFLVNIRVANSKLEPQHIQYLSVMYLLQMRSKRKDFIKLDSKTKLWKSLFNFSNHDTKKFVNQRDIVLRIEEYNFVSVSVKSLHRDQTSLNIPKIDNEIELYDNYAIIVSPIVFENYSYVDFEIILNKVHRVTIFSNAKVELNKYLSEKIEDTIIEFQDDSLHQEHCFLKMGFGRTEMTMDIGRLQTVKLSMTRETVSTCFIQIYAEVNITNFTHQSFCINTSTTMFILDQLSFSCLPDILQANNNSISIIDDSIVTVRIKPNSINNGVTLPKKVSEEKQRLLYPSRVQFQTSKCCSSIREQKTIYEEIEFVVKVQNDPIHELSKKIELKYKYQIRNLTKKKLKLFQFNNQFLIVKMQDFGNYHYIYYYKFIPKQFFIEMMEEETNIKLNSCPFELQTFPGATFVFKFKKSEADSENLDYYERFHYIRVEIRKNEEETLIELLDASFDNFPIYLDNLTDHNIKIIENEDEFTLKPKQRIPFAWSQLISQQNKLEVRIEGAEPQFYWFNKKSTFEPIKITDKTKKKKKKRNDNLYLKQICYVNYPMQGLTGQYMVILDLFDNKLRIHDTGEGVNTEINMQDVQRMEPLSSKIEIYFTDGKMLEISPSPRSIKKWIDHLHESMNEDVIDKISFTIQVYRHSRIYFFRTMIEQENYQSSKQECMITHLNISIINSQPEEVILLYCGNISYSQQDKASKLNYKNLQSQISERVINIRKLKVSNQTLSAVNPVVLSRIKKSNYPFLQIRLIKQNLQLKQEAKGDLTDEQKKAAANEEGLITHYKEASFFLDEAQMIVEAVLFLELEGFKSSIDDISNQYAIGEQNDKLAESREAKGGEQRRKLIPIYEDKSRLVKNPLIYINYLDIKPVKMTISVNLEHSKEEKVKMDFVSIVRYIPFDIENAIIQIDAYLYFHVFYDEKELQKALYNFYWQEIKSQIIKNAGAYDLLVPVKLIQGLGNGVKNIFYDPFYEFVKKKEIKAVGKTLFEGLVSLFLFLITFLIKILSLCFKLLAFFTFDQEYKTKREAFRKQIFKSPDDGFILGAKNYIKVFKSFFLNFTKIKEKYHRYSIFGYLLGFFICCIKIIPWAIKLVVSLYDWVYVTWLGLVNWGFYEESAMKVRSRPRRTFPRKEITCYNYLYAQGNEIIRSNQLEEIQNEQIYFVKPSQKGEDNTHLILSNYRIVYKKNRILGCHQIKLYQIASVESTQDVKKKKYVVRITLSIPNTYKVLFLFSYNTSHYRIEFYLRSDLIKFIRKLKLLCAVQKLAVEFSESKSLQDEIDRGDLLFLEMLNIKKNNDNEESKSNEDGDDVSNDDEMMG